MHALVYSPLAQRDLRDIAHYIAKDSKMAARTWVDRLEAQCMRIATNPLGYVARPDIHTGLRSATLGSYIVLFTVRDEFVRIERVVHGARDLLSLNLI
jgi:plasmid stabilization system protein ParE